MTEHAQTFSHHLRTTWSHRRLNGWRHREHVHRVPSQSHPCCMALTEGSLFNFTGSIRGVFALTIAMRMPCQCCKTKTFEHEKPLILENILRCGARFYHEKSTKLGHFWRGLNNTVRHEATCGWGNLEQAQICPMFLIVFLIISYVRFRNHLVHMRGKFIATEHGFFLHSVFCRHGNRWARDYLSTWATHSPEPN